MNNLIFLIKFVMTSGLLTGYYWFFLRNRFFHQYNRFFLLGIPVFSLVLPFLHISLPGLQNAPAVAAATRLLRVSDGNWEQEVIITPGHSYLQLVLASRFTLLILYMAISAILFVLFLNSLRYIRRITRQHKYQLLNRVKFYETDEKAAPFSFFNRIFWSRRLDVNSAQGQQILRHELYHIQQNHSLDILFLESVHILFWFNPFFFLVRKEIKAIHEFLADQYAVRENNRQEYAELLLVSSLHTKQLNLLNPFFHNQIKRRITMITKIKSIRKNYISRMMILPLLFILFCAFAVKLKTLNPGKPLTKSITVIIDAGHGGEDPGAKSPKGLAEKDIALSIAKKIKTLSKDYDIRIILTRDNDQLAGKTQDVRESLKYRADLAAQTHADLFVSVHVNAETPTADNKGFEIYVSDQNPQSSKSIILGSILTASIKKDYAIADELKKRTTGIMVLKANTVPAVLLECGNISDASDEAFITDEKNQEIIARDILTGLAKYGQENTYVEPPAEKTTDALVSNSRGPNELTEEPLVVQDSAYSKVEVEAEFPGGINAWMAYLKTHLKYPDAAVSKEVSGDVLIQFIVNKSGDVLDVKAVSGPASLRAESIRVVKESGKWTPAVQNGKPVNSYRKQPIKFRLEKIK